MYFHTIFVTNWPQHSIHKMLDLDVDSLFEKHSVAEVETVNQKIRDEIEKKKEELRSMVG